MNDNKVRLLLQAAAAVNIILAKSVLKKYKGKKRNGTQAWLKRRQPQGPGVLRMLNEELALEDQASYKNYLRVTKENFDKLLGLVITDIQKTNTLMQSTISARSRLEITLRYLATGDCFRSLMYNGRVHESSISRFIPEVCHAIYKHLVNYLKAPGSIIAWLNISKEFSDIWQFPNCVGALDGRHIKFRPPRSEGSYNYNYKGDHSIVLLAVCDANYKFTYVNVGCNGRISDEGVFRESMLSTALESNAKALLGRTLPIPYVIVAHDAFPHKDTVMKPYPHRGLSQNERKYNYRISRARRVIEIFFGILANRFRVLLNPIPLRVEKVEIITLACVALHNYLTTENAHLYVDGSINDTTAEELQKIRKQGVNKSMRHARMVREDFKEYFSSDIGKSSLAR